MYIMHYVLYIHICVYYIWKLVFRTTTHTTVRRRVKGNVYFLKGVGDILF